jgi:multidrug efflux pump subunit AcrA (membrane-fusion protein)
MNPTLNHNGTAELEPPPEHRRPTVAHVEHHAPRPPQPAKAQPRTGKSHAGRTLLIAIFVAVAVVAILLLLRSRSYHQLAATTTEMALPTVAVTQPQPGPTETEIQLPGNLMAYNEASIYARTNGYLKAWYTDIGARLKAGQLMAEIEAPDVDAQLRQATADLAQARAALDLDQLNFARAKELLATKVISQQEYDQNHTNVDAGRAAVHAGEANVQDLTVQRDFQKITAPFDGVVTRRDTDVGHRAGTLPRGPHRYPSRLCLRAGNL